MYNSGSNNLGFLLYYCKKIIYETAGAYARCHIKFYQNISMIFLITISFH